MATFVIAQASDFSVDFVQDSALSGRLATLHC